MKPQLTVPPAVLAVTLEDAKKNLRIDGNYQDSMVELWLWGVITFAENFTERSIMEQTWTQKRDCFPSNGIIKLKRPPVMEVESIKYYDAANVLQTLDPADYQVDNASDRAGFIVPGVGLGWPVTFPRINAVEIRYRCGYGNTAVATPRDLKLYVLAKLNEQFDPLVRPDKETVQTTFIDGLLDPYLTY
jgi:uncharacterized phiE125 gp8 family phage protein